MEKLRIGISACLLGARVRYDGGHKRDGFLTGVLGAFAQWVPVCPEAEVGMGVPREPVRLLRTRGDGTRMRGCESGEDWTARMNAFAEQRVGGLDDLDGFVLKSRSPSCGMERVRRYPEQTPDRAPSRDGVGLFAAALLRRWPNLPVEEEGRLEDPRLRESFVERLYAYHRLRALWASRWKLGELVAFHTAHKMSLLAHSPEGYRALGRLVAQAKALPRATLRERYEGALMAVLRRPSSRGRHANVLSHLLGHLRERLDAADRQELVALIQDYRRGLVPLVVPLTLLRHHGRRLAVATLDGQSYLEPHPGELMLRNHV
jgi:uncharacterized protein YbgA (DUF1722 family)/uncharacterized protein YbbK (DUF523 family)